MVSRLRKLRNKFIVFLIVAGLIAIGIGFVWLRNVTEDDHLSFGLSSDKIDDTPMIVTKIKNIGEWEFLAVSDEEFVDTVRKGIFFDDKLARIYYGTLRIGIDFSLCNEEWLKKDGDSIRVLLPPVKLLDENFLDEANTKPFYEKGNWSNEDRRKLTERAKAAMRARCLTKENMQRAQKEAERHISRFVNTIYQKRDR